MLGSETNVVRWGGEGAMKDQKRETKDGEF